jgi:penicillin-binding protein 1A
VLQSVGTDAVLAHAAKFGFNTENFPRTLSLALGTQVVSPLEMATGFTVFANGGYKVEPYLISRIEDSSGKVLFEAAPKIVCQACESAPGYPLLEGAAAQTVDAGAAPPTSGPGASSVAGEAGAGNAELTDAASLMASAPPAAFGLDDVPDSLRRLASLQGGLGYLPSARIAPRVLSAQNAWLMDSMMHDVAMRGTAKRTRALQRDDLAGKTGTNGSRDLWFNGFNGRLVASVWVGFDDERSLGESEQGGTAAVPIWMHYMREALKGVPSSRMARPGGLIDLRISPLTGALANPTDPDAIYETFMVEHQPRGAEPGDPGYVPGTSGPGSSPEKGGEPLF